MESDSQPDRPLSTEEKERVAALSSEQVASIDAELIVHASPMWRKVAYLVGMSMSTQKDRVRGIPDLYYAERVRILVGKGTLEATGNLESMRWSEVRRGKA